MLMVAGFRGSRVAAKDTVSFLSVKTSKRRPFAVATGDESLPIMAKRKDSVRVEIPMLEHCSRRNLFSSVATE
jgi:hypothetical protein